MYRFIVTLLQPYSLVYVLTGLAILNLWRTRRRPTAGLLAVSFLFTLLTLLSVPAVSYGALGTLEWRYPPLESRPVDAQAIVVLAAGIRPPNKIRARAEMDQDTLYRCLHAAELYRQGKPCPMLLSGGKVDPDDPGPPAAEVMRDFLLQLGVIPSDLILETVSRTTYENAVESRRRLDALGLRRIVLVTDGVDIPRALRCFIKQGIETIPSGCHYRATQLDDSLFDWLPSPSAAHNIERVFHEWLGIVWYRLHGRI